MAAGRAREAARGAARRRRHPPTNSRDLVPRRRGLRNRLKPVDKARTAYEQSLVALPEFRPAREGLTRLLTLSREEAPREELDREAKVCRIRRLPWPRCCAKRGGARRARGSDARHRVLRGRLERDPAHVEALRRSRSCIGEGRVGDLLARIYATRRACSPIRGAASPYCASLPAGGASRGDDFAPVRDAELMLLQLSPNDPAALAALERLALRSADPCWSGRWTRSWRAGAPAGRSEHTTRFAELLEATGDASALGLFRSRFHASPRILRGARLRALATFW